MGPGEEIDQQTMEAARTLGRLIAEQGWVLLSGGRDSGVMKAVSEGAKQVPGSLTVGILPSVDTRPSPHLDILIITDMGNARNNVNVLSSDIVVAVGQGGAGTASEVALALKAGKKVILLGAHPLAQSFFQALKKKLVFVAQTPLEAISLIKTFRTDE
jgi:uncharacterized protein (TIGR00725 family)